ncbi:MAG: cytochrome c oxidase subunit II [Planctomycetota bacterium]
MALLENIYPDAKIIDQLFMKAVWLTGIAFVAVVLILIYCLIQFRAREGHRAAYIQGNSPFALWMTIGLAVTVFIGIDLNLAWSDHHAFDVMFAKPPAADQAVVVDVIAEHFNWNFHYAGADGLWNTDDDIYTGELVVPTGKKVLLRMRSLDVVHCLSLPECRIKQDVVPGLQTQMWFDVDKTTAQARQEYGKTFDYEIACDQLCGSQHTKMRGVLTILTPPEFDQWVKDQSKVAGDMAVPDCWKHWDACLPPPPPAAPSAKNERAAAAPTAPTAPTGADLPGSPVSSAPAAPPAVLLEASTQSGHLESPHP